MKLLDFIQLIINSNTVDDVLNNFSTQSEKGFAYERMWDLIIKFGFCPTFPNSKYTHMNGNFNTGKLKELTSLKHYINNNVVVSGNSGGASDITLYNTTDNKYIFISSKYPKSDNDKNVEYYDVHKILAVLEKKKDIYENYDIYILTLDKQEVLIKAKQAKKSNHHITKYMTNTHIFDKSDLEKCYLNFKTHVSKNVIDDFDEIYLSKRDFLELRFHQELITDKTLMLIEEGHKQFLWGCKPRSGKTYMVGGLIIKYLEMYKRLNTMIITPAPTETSPQFTEGLFNKFIDFKKFNIIHITSAKEMKSMTFDENNNHIIIVSKQLLQGYIGENVNKTLQQLKFNIISFDENHFSGTTDISKNILDTYSTKNTVKVYLTATYNKPLREWGIKDICQMYWDIEDEQICKKIVLDENELEKLIQKHGDIVTHTVNTFKKNKLLSVSEIFEPYLKMPDLHLITTLFDKTRYENIKEKIMDTKYGFSFDVLFALNPKKNSFVYKNEVSEVLRYISGSNKEKDFKFGDHSIFSRINKICTNSNSRSPFTQIWFLPPNNINETSKCLKQLIEYDGILSKYDVMIINSKITSLAKDVKDEIMQQEIISSKNGKRGLILLAGNMLSLGITLNNCDIVLLMNNALSSDKIMQQMYRCMTEGNNKKFGFVVDLKLSRVLNTCINYSIYKNNLNVADKIKYMIENHLINIDEDMLVSKKLDSNKLVNELLDVWKSDPINSFKSLLQNIDNDYVLFDNETQKLLNKSFTHSSKNNINATIEIEINEDDKQEFPDGNEKIKDSEHEQDNSKETVIKEIQISFTKDVLPYVIPLACILTVKDSNKDFVEMLSIISNNSDLLEIFDEQSYIWWNKKGLIDIIKNIIGKYFDKKSNTYNISIQFKMSLQSLIDKPKELLELINECLKPKDSEKKKFGEVFTPMDFINNSMLKDLEVYYMKKYNKNIWENENLTWYDPAVGMGNYPIAIYYKLINGLKKKIPDEQERKKHIIENMIYMAELNKKNCFVIKQIFNINKEYKLNLYEGDSLNFDTKKVFNKESFDIIIGNPPYNEELTKIGAKPLYNHFIEHNINKCTILSFIVPSRWFSGGKGLDKFRSEMLKRKDLVYIKHHEDACKIFGNTVDIKGGVNYFVKDTNHNGDCEYNGTMIKLGTYDIIVDSKYTALINKILPLTKITDLYRSQDYYKIQTNDKRLVDNPTKDTVKCYVSKQKGSYKYIDKKEIRADMSKYKILAPDGAFGHGSGFGNLILAKPDEVHTKTYISFEVDTEDDANSLLSYMKCRLPNFLLSIRKNSQHTSETTCKWIPLPPLDKLWTDDDVYKHFKLFPDEINIIINAEIDGYKNIMQTNQDKEIDKINTDDGFNTDDDFMLELNQKFDDIQKEYDEIVKQHNNKVIIIKPKKKKVVINDIFDS
ncbi:restriction-modification methylase [Klosneuvirus KNV1]|uniref:Restriction-modification methylase n=1 Tax=Klosneuvirus KNV1 TaxID=1977640 RepID=A0A1V0SII8_9VIRU|nr:restriction-modification methylase [Klosneuvirus KNV1]